MLYDVPVTRDTLLLLFCTLLHRREHPFPRFANGKSAPVDHGGNIFMTQKKQLHLFWQNEG
jgi:hypothetical protein